jgi:cyclopropane-fatty-acyl-phospholipid synthase
MSLSYFCFKCLYGAFLALKWIERIFIRLLKPFVKRRIVSDLQDLGVIVNGSQPWDIQVRSDEFYVRAASETTLGVCESYLNNEWDVKDLEELLTRIVKSDKFYHKANRATVAHFLSMFNLQNSTRSFEVGKSHYGIGNWNRYK